MTRNAGKPRPETRAPSANKIRIMLLAGAAVYCCLSVAQMLAPSPPRTTHASSGSLTAPLPAALAAAAAASPEAQPAVAETQPEPAPDPDPSMLATFTWTGGGPDALWDSITNWSALGGLGYPDDCADDALIPSSILGFQIALIDVTIDDLTITGDVDFSSVGSTQKTLNTDSLTIQGACEITFTDARVRASTCPAP